MSGNRAVLLMSCILLTSPAFAGDETSDAIEAFRKQAQSCNTSPGKEIGFELQTVPGKPVSVPATKEEVARIKELLAKSSMPYDPTNHRATYQVALALVRTKSVAVFKIAPESDANLSAIRDCLTKLASESGLEASFE